MKPNALDTCMAAIEATWGSLTAKMASDCRLQLEQLLLTAASEDWLSALHRTQPISSELYRSPVNGFMLLAHTEQEGLYRPPHDHGRGWVIYAVQQGEIEMGTYARVEEPDGKIRLVKRDSTLVRAGQTRMFWPGDIHDTLCVSGPALLFRFTDRDLRREDREEHRLTRYVESDGAWTTPAHD